MSKPEQPEIDWELVTDSVMGGVSKGQLTRESVGGRSAIRLRGQVSLANNGGFVQMAADLATDNNVFDASAFSGLCFDAFGNDETYECRIRTARLTRPWQSYKSDFVARPDWETICLSFHDFTPHRTDQPLDLTQLRRVGILAIGRAFHGDVALRNLRFF